MSSIYLHLFLFIVFFLPINAWKTLDYVEKSRIICLFNKLFFHRWDSCSLEHFILF